MASASTGRDPDLEAQQDLLQPHREGEIRETTNRPSGTDNGPSRLPADLAHPDDPVDFGSHTIDVQGINYGTSTHHPEREDTTRQIPTPLGHGEVQPGADTHAQDVVDPNSGPVPDSSNAEPHMIDGSHTSTNPLWSLYGKEAESHDKARIQPLKEDMDGVLIFAGLFSAALTSFVLDSKQNLQVKPADLMVYYLQQHSTILSQISQQIASIAPHVSIPSSPPPPFPSFTPSISDIRINVFWFMALAFSLSAALLATLVQQWVRDYMHVFQRYSDPQKSCRMRQYLSEGSEGWYMPIAAEAVPGLLHVSLFLFFAGLADATLNINTTIGLSTTVPIGLCGLLYIFITLAPVIYPQSPYQTSFSGAIWYAVQKLRGRRFKDRDGNVKPVSTNMAQGQMQLSMEGTMDREGRDKRAILWLMDNLTEDNEIETFVMSMPGSLEAWTRASNEEVKPHVSRSSLRLRTIGDVFDWVTGQFKTIFDVIWLCFLLLTHYALLSIPYALRSIYKNCKLTPHYFQRIRTLIRHQFQTSSASPSSTIAMVPRPASRRPLVATSEHESNTIREFCWRIGHFFDTCKNRAIFARDGVWRKRYRACVEVMASLVSFADVELGWFRHTLQALGDISSFEGTRKLSLSGKDEVFVVHWTCLSIIAIRPTLNTSLFMGQTFKFISFLYDQSQVGDPRAFDGTLEHRWSSECNWDLSSKISFAVEMEKFSHIMNSNVIKFDELCQRLTHELPGVDFDFPNSGPLFLRQTLELFRDPAKLRFMSSRQPLKFFEYLKCVDAYRDDSPNPEYERNQVTEKVFWPKHLLQRMLWSIDDLCGGGLGFSVEVFLLSLRQLLSTYPSQESHSALFIGTFKAITSDRKRYTFSVGTLSLLLDVVASDQGFVRTFNYPDYITDEVWELLGDILEVQGSYYIKPYTINNAVQQLTDLQREVGGKYGAKAEALISRLRASRPQGMTDRALP